MPQLKGFELTSWIFAPSFNVNKGRPSPKVIGTLLMMILMTCRLFLPPGVISVLRLILSWLISILISTPPPHQKKNLPRKKTKWRITGQYVELKRFALPSNIWHKDHPRPIQPSRSCWGVQHPKSHGSFHHRRHKHLWHHWQPALRGSPAKVPRMPTKGN